MTVRMASAKQTGFIDRLLAQRETSAEQRAFIDDLLEDGTSRHASMVIDFLMGQPWKPTEGHRSEAAGVGVYRHDGRIFVIREFTPRYEDRKVRYAREIVDLSKSQGDRLDTDGKHVRYGEIKAKGMQYRVADEELIPLDELSTLGVQFGHCIVCGAKLEVAESVEHGIGPVCASRQAGRIAGTAA